MTLKEPHYWMTAIVAGLISTFFAAFVGNYDDFRYGALVSLGFVNAYRISKIEQDHEPEPEMAGDFEPFEPERWDGRVE